MPQNSPLSAKKRLANQRNAQKSTGPKTPEGKKRSSTNAITHGVFCQEVVIVKEDLPLFKALRREMIQDLKPQRLVEMQMVDKIVECTWKQRRLRVSEATEYEAELRGELETRGVTWDQEMANDHHPDYCAPVAMTRMMDRDYCGLEHYSRLDQRLQNMIHRCLKELRTLREDRAEIDGLPSSPFEETVEEVEYQWATGWDQKENAASESTEGSQGAEEVEEKSPADGSPSPLPLTSHEYVGTPSEGEGRKAAGEAASTVCLPSGAEMQNEATVGRRFDADVTCAADDASFSHERDRRYTAERESERT